MKYCNEVTLKNGLPCVVRHASAEDAQNMIDAMRLTAGESDNLIRYPDELTLTLEEEETYLSEAVDNPAGATLCAIVDGKIVADAGFREIGSFHRLKHRASFGIAVAKDYWGLGLGKALTSACLSLAKQAGYAQMELEVVTENHAAIHLYESLGFHTTGTIPRAMGHRDGSYNSFHYMVCPLDGGPEEFPPNR